MANIKDYIIEKDEILKNPIKPKSESKSQVPIRLYTLIYENNTDFIIKRTTKTTEKDFVFLVSQDLFYINDVKKDVKVTMNKKNISTFFSDANKSNCDFNFQKVQYIDSETPIYHYNILEQILLDEKLRIIISNNFYNEFLQIAKSISYYESDVKILISTYLKHDKKSFMYCLNNGLENLLEVSCALTIKRMFGYNNMLHFIKCYKNSQVELKSIGAYPLYKVNLYGEDAGYNSELLRLENISFKAESFIEYITYGFKSQGNLPVINTIRDYYYDYLDMENSMYDTIKNKYPKYLKTEHDKTTYKYNLNKEYFQDKKMLTIANEYLDLGYSNKKYTIILPKYTADIVKEGVNQSNCVASYVKRILDEKCFIVFMRETDSIEESLVTIEIQDNEIMQCKGYNNRNITDEERKFIKEWAKKKNLKFD